MEKFAQFVTSIGSESDDRFADEVKNDMVDDNVFLEELGDGQKREKKFGMGNQELDLEAIGKKIMLKEIIECKI